MSKLDVTNHDTLGIELPMPSIRFLTEAKEKKLRTAFGKALKIDDEAQTLRGLIIDVIHDAQSVEEANAWIDEALKKQEPANQKQLSAKNGSFMSTKSQLMRALRLGVSFEDENGKRRSQKALNDACDEVDPEKQKVVDIDASKPMTNPIELKINGVAVEIPQEAAPMFIFLAGMNQSQYDEALPKIERILKQVAPTQKVK